MSRDKAWNEAFTKKHTIPKNATFTIRQNAVKVTPAPSMVEDTSIRVTATLLTNHYEIVNTNATRPAPVTAEAPATSRSPVKGSPSKASVSSPSKVTATRSPPTRSPPTKRSGAGLQKSPTPSRADLSFPQGAPSNPVAVNDIRFYRYKLNFKRRWQLAEDKRHEERVAKAKKNKKPVPTREANPEPSPKAKRRLICLLLRRLRDVFSFPNVASDYHGWLVTCTPLPASVTSSDHRIIFQGDYATAVAATYPVYDIEIEAGLQLMSLESLAVSQQSSTDPPIQNEAHKPTVDALNALLTQIANEATFRDRPNTASTQLTRVGSKKFFQLNVTDDLGPWNLDDIYDVNYGLGVRTGFYVSVRIPGGPHARPLLNVNTTTSAFYRSGNLLEVLLTDADDKVDYIAHMAKLLMGAQVRTTYLMAGTKPKNKESEFVFSGLAVPDNKAASRASRMSFKDEDKKLITVENYFRQNYPRADVRPNDLLVKVGTKDDIWIPAKLLEVRPGQVFRRPINMTRQAVRAPIDNRNLIQQYGKVMFGINGRNGVSQISVSLHTV
jgi:hypothetical protein